MVKISNCVEKVIVYLIKGYRLLISPVMLCQCRFTPSCSVYIMTAVKRFGVLNGLCLGGKRILRCHPWHEGGVDYVPDTVKR